MSLHRTCDPQAIYIDITVSLDRYPCILCRNIFDEALPAFLAPIKNKPLVKPLFHPFFLRNALFARHCAADVLVVYIVFCDPYVIHLSSFPLYY